MEINSNMMNNADYAKSSSSTTNIQDINKVGTEEKNGAPVDKSKHDTISISEEAYGRLNNANVTTSDSATNENPDISQKSSGVNITSLSASAPPPPPPASSSADATSTTDLTSLTEQELDALVLEGEITSAERDDELAESDFGTCLVKIDGRKVAHKVESPEYARGEIARTYLYMEDSYPRHTMSKKQRMLTHIWNTEYPVTYGECQRTKRIASLQGNENTIVKNQCLEQNMW